MNDADTLGPVVHTICDRVGGELGAGQNNWPDVLMTEEDTEADADGAQTGASRMIACRAAGIETQQVY